MKYDNIKYRFLTILKYSISRRNVQMPLTIFGGGAVTKLKTSPKSQRLVEPQL